MRELVDISTYDTPREVVYHFLQHIGTNKPPFILFTGVVGKRELRLSDHADRDDDYGSALVNYIEAERLGDVVTSIPPKRNWTGNEVKVWMWMPDYAKLRGMMECQ